MKELKKELRKLMRGCKKTTVISRYDRPRLHHLEFCKAVIFYDNATCGDGLVVIGLGSRKGSKQRIKEFLIEN